MPFTPEKKKQLYAENRTEVIARAKKYYADHKDTIQAKTVCTLCHATVTRSYLKKHQKTYRCQLNAAYKQSAPIP